MLWVLIRRLGTSDESHNICFHGEKRKYFSYVSMKMYVVGTHEKRLNEPLLMSTSTYVFVEK